MHLEKGEYGSQETVREHLRVTRSVAGTQKHLQTVKNDARAAEHFNAKRQIFVDFLLGRYVSLRKFSPEK